MAARAATLWPLDQRGRWCSGEGPLLHPGMTCCEGTNRLQRPLLFSYVKWEQGCLPQT